MAALEMRDAAWAFDAFGFIYVPLAAASEEKLFEIAVEAGAENVEKQDEQWVITTATDALDAVRKAVVDAGVEVTEAELDRVAKTPKALEGRDAEVAMQLFEALDDHDDVQKVHTEFDPSDELMENM